MGNSRERNAFSIPFTYKPIPHLTYYANVGRNLADVKERLFCASVMREN